ncbi:predicted protein [Fibroporia radiculosa]|uniref:Uncharacterized protein n=1 Tax=Fibroporia radiculosa TaxID=599839 RepID=J7RHF1_9APHY|nr:predicted protein [Fibroporia radiculosa]
MRTGTVNLFFVFDKLNIHERMFYA